MESSHGALADVQTEGTHVWILKRASLLSNGNTPFYRLAKLQAAFGVPLSQGTLWDRVLAVAKAVRPVADHLSDLAARADLIHCDDTPVRILTLIDEYTKQSLATHVAWSIRAVDALSSLFDVDGLRLKSDVALKTPLRGDTADVAAEERGVLHEQRSARVEAHVHRLEVDVEARRGVPAQFAPQSLDAA